MQKGGINDDDQAFPTWLQRFTIVTPSEPGQIHTVREEGEGLNGIELNVIDSFYPVSDTVPEQELRCIWERNA